MVYLTVPFPWSEAGQEEAHLINSEHGERLNEHHVPTERVTAVPLCNSRSGHTNTMSRSFDIPVDLIVPASEFTNRTEVWREWDQAKHVDALPDLITRLTVDGVMCTVCVEEHRDRVGGIKGLGRRYYEDRHGVDLPDRKGRWAARRG